MKQRTDSQGVPYSYLVDNIKVVLIFLVVFNHLIAFQLAKVDMVHVPYKGSAPAVTDLLGNQIGIMFDNMP